jgi:hypothetical protein
MEARDLRIGNLIYDYRGEIVTINQIILNESFYFVGVKENHSRYLFDEIRPIPLTEEWLLKFGCKKLNNVTYVTPEIKQHSTYIRRCRKYYFYCALNNFRSVDLRFVHTFQNFIFALTGEELIYKP